MARSRLPGLGLGLVGGLTVRSMVSVVGVAGAGVVGIMIVWIIRSSVAVSVACTAIALISLHAIPAVISHS